ncbi:MAG: ParB N-terminal domain-containing protein [Pseudomonadota bacterium]
MALEVTTEFPVGELLLDPDNPRLPDYVDKRNQNELLSFLARSAALDELINAIGSNGYFASEPLIGVRQENGDIIIVEGNRRLSALKLLNGENIADAPAKVSRALELATTRPRSVPVSVYTDKADILNYLGNKHIAGVKPWGALAKARYAKQLLALQPGDDPDENIRLVARAIGSRRDFIVRATKALEAYEVSEQTEFFNLDGVDESTVKFSVLSTALDYEGIQSFVFAAQENEHDAREINQDNLKLLFSWLFQKDRQGRTRLGESRNIGMLSRVLASERSRKAFIEGTPLAQAYRLTDGVSIEFDSLATQVLSGLREANSLVADVDSTPDRGETAVSIFKQARQLKRYFDED